MKRNRRPLTMVAVLYLLLLLIVDFFRESAEKIQVPSEASFIGMVKEVSLFPAFSGRRIKLTVDTKGKAYGKLFVTLDEKLLERSGKKADEICYGDLVRVEGRLAPLPSATNPGQFDPASYYGNEGFRGTAEAKEIIFLKGDFFHGIRTFLPASLFRVRRKISENFKRILKEPDAGTLSAMVLGDKSTLSEEVRELYSSNAVSHILAISGLHVSLLGFMIFTFLKKIGCSFRTAHFLPVIFLLLYGIFTGSSVSTTRAVIMMSLFFFSFSVGRSYDLPSALAFSSLVLLVADHRQLYQPGFQLSFLAVVGIYYGGTEIRKSFESIKKEKKGIRHSIFGTVRDIWICSLAVNAFLLPVLLLYFYEIPLTGFLLNLFILPLMSILVATGLIGGFLSLMFPAAGTFFLGSSHYILSFYTFLCRLFHGNRYQKLILGRPETYKIVIYYILLFLLFYFLGRMRRKEIIKNRTEEIGEKERHALGLARRMMIAIGFTLCVIVIGKKGEGFSVTMLDIGQGDAFIISTERGHVYLSDCGSTTRSRVGKYRLLPFLKFHGKRRLSGIFVSHMDKDHVNGINEILFEEDIVTDRIFISVGYENEELECEEFKKLRELAGKRNIGITYLKRGDVISDGEVRFTCLYPKKGDLIHEQNEASIVMRLDYEKFSMLFTGDLGREGEKRLLGYGDTENLDTDLLKVGHHGSKNSSTEEFLEAVSPGFSFISCGERNHYGHPHRDSIRRLARIGSKIFRTDEEGAVKITYKPEHGLRIETWKFP